ncbi:MAG TPA: RNA polymerase sigma factor [Candidatus Limnocylindrales bacterium]|nr:RNA polymerase sigma factor [Candidatus Limnocylindrales bacterium]
MTQRELVERARRGDHDAFASLLHGSIGRLEAVARLVLRDPDLARDAVQDAYIRAWRDLPGLRDPDRFDAWIHRLTVNACLDVTRRRRRRPIEIQLTPVGPTAIPDESMAVAQRDELERGFDRLSADQRAVLVLHYYVGMSMPALAAALGIPLGTAQSRLGRALVALRAAIEAQPEPTPIRRGQTA